jgi:glycosyltransferase involved in cell wall biosynthesis
VARVLVIQNLYPPHHYGGYELSCRDVVERWRRRGHEVLVLTSNLRLRGVDDPPSERSTGVWRDLPIAFSDTQLVSPPIRSRPAIERAAERSLAHAIEACRPDVVSLWHMAALPFGLITTLARSSTPVVYVVCDDWLSYAARMDPWMRLFVGRPRLGRLVERFFGIAATVPDVGASGSFCFVSEVTRQRSIEHTQWSFPVATVTYSGIDIDDFPIEHTTEERPWRWRLLHVGRLDERKGIATAVEALAHLPADAELQILGTGDEAYRHQLQQTADRVGASQRVHFGAVSRSELRRHYHEADVFVFPTNWEEPFGLVPLEAMACGTPVVATGRGGSGEFLVDGINCLRFPAEDAPSLAEQIRRLAVDAALRRRLVTAGSQTAAQLTVDRLADVLEEWHLAAAQGFPDGPPSDRRPNLATLGLRGQSPA